MAKNIDIQFPNDANNEYWDGLRHNVDAEKLYNLDYSNYWLLQGYDHSHDCGMVTLLERRDGEFKKVPLDNYEDDFNNLIEECNRIAWPVDVLPDIELGRNMTVEELRKELNRPVKKR